MTVGAMDIRDVQARIHRWSIERGWTEEFDAVKRAAGAEGFRMLAALIAEKLALVHSEVSEAVEVLRDCKTLEQVSGSVYDGAKPVGFDSELADIVVRVFNLASMLGIDMAQALSHKMDYNDTRPYRHGGRTI